MPNTKNKKYLRAVQGEGTNLDNSVDRACVESVSWESVQRVQHNRVEFVPEFMQFSAGQQRQLKPENKKEPEDQNRLLELV